MRSARLAGGFLLLAGAALFIASALGRSTRLGAYRSAPPRPWERLDPALVARTPDLASLFAEAQSRAGAPLASLPPATAMDILWETTGARFTNGGDSTYNFFSNWILRGYATIRGQRFHINDPDTVLRLGHSALCDEMAFVLYRLAGMAGIPARLVHLEGHVIMEAAYDGGWHAYDPDQEIVIRNDAGVVLGVEQLILEPARIRRAYAAREGDAFGARVEKIFTSREDNYVRVYRKPTDRPGTGRIARPGTIETIAGPARFAVPLAMMAAGLAILPFGKKGEAAT